MIHVVPAESAGWRIDRFLAELLGCSLNEARRVLKRSVVRVDGKRPKKGDAVSAGQKVEIPDDVTTDTRPLPDPSLTLSILHEDDAIIAFDKPVGMPSQPLRPGELGTLANAIIAKLPACADASSDPREAGLVHRLDVATSGVIVAAKSRAIWTAMREEFSAHRVDKTYLTVVEGAPSQQEGEIDLPLSHSGPKRMRAQDIADAKPAMTRYVVLDRSRDWAWLRAESATGRMHQIRAHLAAIGHPLYGDVLYGAAAVADYPHHLLHAESISFVHPTTKTQLTLRAPLPKRTKEIVSQLGLDPKNA